MDLFPAVKPALLVVGEEEEHIAQVAMLLKSDYSIWSAVEEKSALDIAARELPDLILLDTGMSGLNWCEFCRLLKSVDRTRHIPVILMAEKAETGDEDSGRDLGVVDFIYRPYDGATLRARIRSHTADLSNARTNRISNAYLEIEVERRTAQLQALQNVTVLALATLAETRDTETGNHLRRTQNYVRVLASHLANYPRFSDYLTVDRINNICKCAPLHDIGKVGIPDRILHKPGRFTQEEFEVIKKHPILGYEALLIAQEAAGSDLEFLDLAKEIVLCHHERWDGGGYPNGLRGNNIPVPARLMAIADVYDALISRRIYKPGISHDEAVQVIARGSGTHFDPEIVDAFLEIQAKFDEIAADFADSDMELRHKSDFINLFVLGESVP